MDSWSEQHEAGESVIHTAQHKEEGTYRRHLDATYQAKIVNEPSKHVIHLATHYTPLCNIIKGSKIVVSMETMKKEVIVGNSHTYDMDKLYARLLVVSQHIYIHLSDL